MNWYYAKAGQQAGPVDEAQLDALLGSGQIDSETLVWREGMANWQPHREARPAATQGVPGQAPAAAGQGATSGGTSEAVCAECGKLFPIDSTIQYGNVRVCAGCKPVFMQKLAEGAKMGGTSLDYAGFWIRFGAKFLDIENDGDLDMYLLNHSVHSVRTHGNALLRNESDPVSGDKLYRAGKPY